jgi:hypothetical protein
MATTVNYYFNVIKGRLIGDENGSQFGPDLVPYSAIEKF